MANSTATPREGGHDPAFDDSEIEAILSVFEGGHDPAFDDSEIEAILSVFEGGHDPS